MLIIGDIGVGDIDNRQPKILRSICDSDSSKQAFGSADIAAALTLSAFDVHPDQVQQTSRNRLHRWLKSK